MIVYSHTLEGAKKISEHEYCPWLQRGAKSPGRLLKLLVQKTTPKLESPFGLSDSMFRLNGGWGVNVVASLLVPLLAFAILLNKSRSCGMPFFSRIYLMFLQYWGK